MKKFSIVVLLGALALVGCGSSEESGGAAGNDVKQLPASAPVTTQEQSAAQAEVANDPKAEKPRADGS